MKYDSSAAPASAGDEGLGEESLLRVCEDYAADSAEAPAPLVDDYMEPRDEESIEQYFDNLMQRIGMVKQEATETNAAPPAIANTGPRSAAAVPARRAETAQQAAQRRRTMPENIEKLNAMRELSVASAQEAIGSSDAKWLERINADLMVTGITLVLAVMLMALSTGSISGYYWAALATLGVSLFFGCRVLRRIRTLDSRKVNNDRQ